jgi:cell division septation protein DedD
VAYQVEQSTLLHGVHLLKVHVSRLSRIALVSACLAVFAACNQTDEAWETTVSTDTPDAYAAFLERFPKSEHADKARARRDALIDQRDWSVARRENTADAYSKYLSIHPEGVWSKLAASRRDKLTNATSETVSEAVAPQESAVADPQAPMEAAPQAPIAAAPQTPTATAPQASAAAVPAAPVVVEPPASTKKHFVQLGAFSSTSSAKKGWTFLQRSFVELADRSPVIDAAPLRGSSLYRLRVQLDSDEEADRVCAALLRGGEQCIKSE